MSDRSAHWVPACICIVVLWIAPLTSAAQSNCDSADISAIELAVCFEPTLSAAARRVETLVSRFAVTDPDEIGRQHQWSVAIRDACEDEACLAEVYLARIDRLEQQLAQMQAQREAERAHAADQEARRNAGVSTMDAPGHIAPGAANASGAREGSSRAAGAGDEQTLWGMSDEQLQLAFIAFVGGVLLLLVLGASNAVVIVYDGMDFFWSMFPLLVVFACGMLFALVSPRDAGYVGSPAQNALLVAGGAGVTHGIIKTYVNATHYNRSVLLGLMIGTFKVLVGLIGVLVLLGAIAGKAEPVAGAGQARHRREGAGTVLVFLFIFAMLYYAVFNGRRVWNKRGWVAATA
jgi:uncharacterized protein